MKKFYVKGVLIPDGDKWIYDLFGVDSVSHAEVRSFLEESNGEEIEVFFDSIGGLITTGSNIYSELRQYEGKSTSYVMGWAASAASWAMLGADKVVASPTARIMIHNAQGSAEGDYRDMEEAAERLVNANNSFINAYQIKTGKSRAEIQDLLDRETFFTAQEALDNGFVDEIDLKEGEQLEPLIAAAMGGINIEKMHELAAKYKDNPEDLLKQRTGNGEETQPTADVLKPQRKELNKLRKKIHNRTAAE